MNSTTTTQKQLIEKLLRGTNKRLTAKQAAAEYGIKNLRARISEMKAAGLAIQRKLEGKRAVDGISRRDIHGGQFRMYKPKAAK